MAADYIGRAIANHDNLPFIQTLAHQPGKGIYIGFRLCSVFQMAFQNNRIVAFPPLAGLHPLSLGLLKRLVSRGRALRRSFRIQYFFHHREKLFYIGVNRHIHVQCRFL